MKRSMKAFVVVSILIAVFGLGLQYACAAGADDTAINPFMKRGWAKLGLSDTQVSAIKAIVKKSLPELQSLTNQVVAERRALRALMRADAINEAAIRSQVAKLASLQADLCVKRAYIRQEVRSTVLTPEQIKKADAARQYREKRFDRYLAGIYKWYAE